MGEVKVPIILQNFSDRALIAAGVRDSVRRHEMVAIVDTGSVMLALPQDVVEKLGLEQARTIVVTYADERREERPVVAPVLLTVAGRDMILEAVVLPPTSPALLGQIPLEGMDLIVDCPKQTLGPRPESPIYPLLNMK